MTNGTMEGQLMMTETEHTVYHLICGWRRLLAEKDFYEAQTNLCAQLKYERIEQFDRLQILLENLMKLLTIDERYVIKRHLVDGLGWDCIEYEYNHKLLRSASKSRSTLRRLQNAAIVKMAQYIAESSGDTLTLGIAIVAKH